ncbi:MAG: HD domain-containing protein [Candidatus Kapabacteria bacterium]|nr:HD domain-containing protein [Ignavibacteriota bacterium]MCW5883710.1 HD domain-containing protein [Candidatus Kapabacteria bacterium]
MDAVESRINELEEMVEDLGNQLAESYFQVVKVLARAVETTEKFYDGSHSRFVSEKSAQVAQLLDMNDEDVMEARIAGLLHDIGKLNFPESCLYKFTSEMTENEYTKYKQHPELGYHILEPYHLLSNISEIIYQHHERLDGSGFPKQLHREAIHPVAKIIAVVDYFHNQMNKRQRAKGENFNGAVQYSSTSSYLDTSRERYTAALNFMSRKSNILYDQKIVDTFIQLMEDERQSLGFRSVMRIPVNGIEPGMVFADDYLTSYGMLIAAKGEVITHESMIAIKRFFEAEELPSKILVVK